MANNFNTVWNKKKVTATGDVGLPPGTLFGGVVMTVAGTSTTLTAYDNTAASGDVHFPTTATLTAGQMVGPMGGVSPITVVGPMNWGVLLTKGLYLTVGGSGSPVFWVLYR